jgi:N-methylhydantoinase B
MSTVDGVTLGILNHYFRAAAEACGYTLERTAYTTFIKESQDFTTGLLTPGGEQFAYPVAIGAQSYIGIDYATLIQSLAPWEPGDIGIANCPFATRGVSTHLPDYHLLKPIFAEGRLVAFAWAFIHSSDMGGIVAGSIQPSAYEIFQEGIRITPKKLYRRGVLDPVVKEFMLSNVRIPEKNWGDLNAVVAALGTGEARVQAACARWGTAVIETAREELLRYAERRARQIIADLPEGRFTFEDYLEDDFVSKNPVRVKLALEKDGADGLHLDFTGSDPQVGAAFNLATHGRHPFLCVALYGFLRTNDPGIPINGGLIRPLRFTAPEGSVVNAVFPAATGVRYAVTQLIFTVVQGALAQALPGRLPAAGAGQATIPAVAMVDPATGRRQVNVIQPMIGGSGGRPWSDGVEGCDISLGSLRNTPCESLEHEVGVRVRRYAVIPDSGGPGRHRGGSALRLDVTVLHGDTILTARGMERTRFQPWGLAGGRAGSPGGCVVNPEAAEARDLGKVNVERLAAGEVVSLRTPGGGGYGDPFGREPARVLADVLDGFVTEEGARAAYGVAIRDGRIDEAETARLRAAPRVEAAPGALDLGTGRQAFRDDFPVAVLDAVAERLFALPVAQRYAAKTLAFRVMREAIAAGARMEPAWVAQHWPAILDRLAGRKAG